MIGSAQRRNDGPATAARRAGLVTYRECAAGLPGVVLWQRVPGPSAGRSRIMPDGCLDLIWDGTELTVAGPDSAARWHEHPPGCEYTGLRFHHGLGPALLGIPACEVLDRSPALDQLWPSAAARPLAARVAADPAAALLAWLAGRAAGARPDPLGRQVHALAGQAVSVTRIADQVGLSARQLHRRCLPLFGYGPRRLSRILRMTRALTQARSGIPLARVAADCGYADQAHLCRDVSALGGASPAALVAELGPLRA